MTRTLVTALALLVSFSIGACASTPVPSPAGSAPGTIPPTASAVPPTVAPPAAASPSAAASAGARELRAGTAPLEAGTWTRGTFRPPVTFAVEDGWTAGTLTDGFVDVQRDQGTPDVIAVQFANPDGVVGDAGAMVPATTAADAVAAIKQNPGLTVVDESASRMSGLEGLNVVVENQGSAHAPILRVPAGTLGIDPGRKLWMALFDTPDGLLAVMVGGSIDEWDRTLGIAEPVLESVVIGDGAAASPSG
jgi:hypothetical protein